MKDEIIEAEVIETEIVTNPEAHEESNKEVALVDALSLTANDIERVAAHLERVKEAVASIMESGIDRDYAVIPGTHKPSLLKPGAEKLLRLFGLGSKIERISEIFLVEENFAKYDYKATVFHIASGKDIASCEGTCSSGETKYKKTTALKGVCDITNTLMKMAQKRAIVGATIYAVGASDYFTQDMEDYKKPTPDKTNSDKFNSEGTPLDDYRVEIGKHKGKTFSEIGCKVLMSYCTYITKQNEGKELSGKMKSLIDKARDWFKTQPKA